MNLKIPISIVLILACTGCSGDGRKLENNFNQMRIALGDDGAGIHSFTSRAKTIKEALKQIEGVEDASVVITGHTALIGLTAPGEENSEEIGRIKKEAAKIAKQTDGGIFHTAITANQEIIDMIDEMEEEKET